MDAFRMAGMALITALLSLTLRNFRPELAMQTALAGGAVILVLAAGELSGILAGLRSIWAELGAGEEALMAAVRVTGIAYITRISSELCRDAGEGALAVKTELCGRLMLFSAALPVLGGLVRLLAGTAELLP